MYRKRILGQFILYYFYFFWLFSFLSSVHLVTLVHCLSFCLSAENVSHSSHVGAVLKFHSSISFYYTIFFFRSQTHFMCQPILSFRFSGVFFFFLFIFSSLFFLRPLFFAWIDLILIWEFFVSNQNLSKKKEREKALLDRMLKVLSFESKAL